MPTPSSVPAKETITAAMSRWAAGLQFKDLSPEAVYQAKRFLLDSLGCALGGYQQHDVRIALALLDEIAGPGRATVIGTGKRIDPVSASLANALMVRCMDYNDIYWKQDPSHPSDIFPAAIACGERARSNGKELIVGLVLGHEFEMRLCEAAFPGIRERGWHHATLTAFVSPIVAGRMLHLTWEQIQHAIGISASRHCTLGAVTAGKLTMMKNTVDPMATQSGVLAAMLAEKGYTGPEHVIDGKEGLTHVFKPEWKLDLLTEGLGNSWRITQCGMKAFPTEALTHTPISAVLDLVKGNDLHPEQVTKIRDSFPGAGSRHTVGSEQIRSAHERDGGSFAALCDCSSAGGAAGYTRPVHHGKNYGPEDSRATSQSRSRGGSGNRKSVSSTTEGNRAY